LETASAGEVLEWAILTYGRRSAITTSFQAEGMVVIDIAARISPDVRVITLDTGRLPEETYQMIETVRTRYGLRVETVSPDRAEVEAMVELHGPNLFYNSAPHRSLCCEIRKVRPLERRLAQFDAWVTGLRREQSDTRSALEKIEHVNGRVKISPLADWTKEQVEAYTIEHNVPRHPLYARGYTSIGCAPCTRATAPGEHERAGRWWWEQGTAKECGIHLSPEGKAERTVDVLLREVLESAGA
jgi:thioredoxin-dependent adenylylsulfate APS reductase